MTDDLFGKEFALTPMERKKLHGAIRRGGHIMPPGTGPASETCGSCKHLFRKQRSKTYLKCSLNRDKWTGGGASDVRAKDAACKKWEAK